jgi:hypothetical protein
MAADAFISWRERCPAMSDRWRSRKNEKNIKYESCLIMFGSFFCCHSHVALVMALVMALVFTLICIWIFIRMFILASVFISVCVLVLFSILI